MPAAPVKIRLSAGLVVTERYVLVSMRCFRIKTLSVVILKKVISWRNHILTALAFRDRQAPVTGYVVGKELSYRHCVGQPHSACVICAGRVFIALQVDSVPFITSGLARQLCCGNSRNLILTKKREVEKGWSSMQKYFYCYYTSNNKGSCR